jgi:sulfur carrier protein
VRVAKALTSCKNFLSIPTDMHSVIALTVNGEARRFDQPLNCQQLIERLNLAGKRVALERNGEIVPRSRLGEQILADGDKLEIVVAVGGG